jgi:hypothetical protein
LNDRRGGEENQCARRDAVDNWEAMSTKISGVEFARQVEHEGFAVVEGVFGTHHAKGD